MIKAEPNKLVVFEGLDATGKTTARKNCGFFTLGEWESGGADGDEYRHNKAHTFHMPSGYDEVSNDLYEYMEHASGIRPLARQLMHLACHEQNMGLIHESFNSKLVVLDRWWWSTYAYGYRGAELDVRIPQAVFMNMIGQVWSGLSADVVYLFDQTYAADAWNNDRVREGYEELAGMSLASTVRVPRGTQEEVRDFLLADMQERRLISGVPA